jgi:hypothetical protein
MQQRTVTASCHLYCCCHRNGIVVTLWHTKSITSCRGSFPSCREGVATGLRHAPALSCMQGMSSINPERQIQSAETRCVVTSDRSCPTNRRCLSLWTFPLSVQYATEPPLVILPMARLAMRPPHQQQQQQQKLAWRPPCLAQTRQHLDAALGAAEEDTIQCDIS